MNKLTKAENGKYISSHLSSLELRVEMDAEATCRHDGIERHTRRLISIMATGVGSDGTCTLEVPILLVFGSHIHSLFVVKVWCALCRKGEYWYLRREGLGFFWTRHCSKHFACAQSWITTITLKYILLLISFYNGGTEKHQ